MEKVSLQELANKGRKNGKGSTDEYVGKKLSQVEADFLREVIGSKGQRVDLFNDMLLYIDSHK